MADDEYVLWMRDGGSPLVADGPKAKHVHWDDDNLYLSRAAVTWLVRGLCAVGLMLGFFGLREGYARLGFDSEGGHILTAAIVIASLTLLGAFTWALHIRRSHPMGDNMGDTAAR